MKAAKRRPAAHPSRGALALRAALAALLVFAGSCGVTSALTAALFNDTTTVPNNGFTTSTIHLGASESTSLSLAGMMPGQSIVAPLLVQNTGGNYLRYSVVSVTTEDTLAAGLVLTIKDRPSSDTTCSAFTGTLLYSGPFGSTTGTNIIGDPTIGQQAYDRTLNSGAHDPLCFQVSLPLTAPNSVESLTTTATFTFAAEQPNHNGSYKTLPAVVASATATNPGGQTSTTLTVPAGVTTREVGFLEFASTAAASTTITVPGWTTMVANPAGEGAMSVSILYRINGMNPGDNITVTQSDSSPATITMVWYSIGGDTPSTGRSTGTRNGASSAGLSASLNPVGNGLEKLVFALNKDTVPGTTIASWSPLSVSTDRYREDSTTGISTFFGTMYSSPGSTGTLTGTYTSPSSDGVLFLLSLSFPNIY